MEEIKPQADSKPNVGGSEGNGDDENINLSVECPSGAPLQFRIKKTTPLRKLMDAYCKKLGLSRLAVRFMFHGGRLQEYDVPKNVGLVDGDEIEVAQLQEGGAGEISPS